MVMKGSFQVGPIITEPRSSLNLGLVFSATRIAANTTLVLLELILEIIYLRYL